MWVRYLAVRQITRDGDTRTYPKPPALPASDTTALPKTAYPLPDMQVLHTAANKKGSPSASTQSINPKGAELLFQRIGAPPTRAQQRAVLVQVFPLLGLTHQPGLLNSIL